MGFRPGQSGNPAGRPLGRRSPTCKYGLHLMTPDNTKLETYTARDGRIMQKRRCKICERLKGIRAYYKKID